MVVDRATGRLLDGTDFVFAAGPAASEAMRARYPQDRPETVLPGEEGAAPPQPSSPAPDRQRAGEA